jgi:hypothetical protein
MTKDDWMVISVIFWLILGMVFGIVGLWVPLVFGTIYGAAIITAYINRGKFRGQNSHGNST